MLAALVCGDVLLLAAVWLLWGCRNVLTTVTKNQKAQVIRMERLSKRGGR